MEGCCTTRSQPIPLRQHHPQQPAIKAPAQAVGLLATTLPGIQTPAETTALQGAGQQHRLIGRQSLLTLQSGIGQQPLKAGGIETSSRQLQNHQHGHRQPWTALLAAIGESPGQVNPDGIDVVEHRGQQRRIAIDLGSHHQHIARFQLRISGEPLKNAITHQLHLPPWTRCRLEQQGLIRATPTQRCSHITVHQLLLQLLQQGSVPPSSHCHLSRCGEEIAIAPFAELHITNPLQQLLKFSAHPSKDRLGAWCCFQPDPIGRLQPAFPQLLTPAAATLPEVGAGCEQIHLNLQQT